MLYEENLAVILLFKESQRHTPYSWWNQQVSLICFYLNTTFLWLVNGVSLGTLIQKLQNGLCMNIHAELEAISSASINISNFRLVDCEIYCTLEPCYMCAMAIVHARIKKIFFATKEPKAGCIISNDHLFNKNFLNHKVIYDYGIYKDKSSLLLKNFFKSLRNK